MTNKTNRHAKSIPADTAEPLALADIRVAVIGDIMLDRYIYGDAERISPEAPIPIVRQKQEQVFPGGAGNVAANLRALGVKAILMGVLGKDHEGETTIALLRRSGVHTAGIIRSHRRHTSVKTRIVASNQQLTRIDRESDMPITEEERQKILSRLKRMMQKLDGMLISDYAKGVLDKRMLRSIIALGRKHHIPIVGDPKNHDFMRYRGMHVLTPNSREFLDAVAERPTRIISPHKLRALRRKLGLHGLVVTLGPDGYVLTSREDAKIVRNKAPALEVFDVTGAGDTFVAVLAAAYFSGFSIKTACDWANVAAGIAVSKLGTATVSLQEIREAGSGDGHKVAHADKAARITRALQQKGKTVVFTNGCFDILHAGHVSLLRRAKSLGDFLIVGINSDRSVSGLKGPGRPLIREQQRASLLSALEDVDMVVIFPQTTPSKLIKQITPDVLVKGDDYRDRKVVGRDWVESHGGRVCLLPLEGNDSTTMILSRIRQSE